MLLQSDEGVKSDNFCLSENSEYDDQQSASTA